MVVTSTDNPMNESDDAGPMRLGDSGGDSKGSPRGKKGKKAAEEDDDGGYESTAHFMDDVFGEWLTMDSNDMSFKELTEWSEVSEFAPVPEPTPPSCRPFPGWPPPSPRSWRSAAGLTAPIYVAARFADRPRRGYERR
jgi:hypothetical protein